MSSFLTVWMGLLKHLKTDFQSSSMHGWYAKIGLPRFCHHCSIVLKGTVNLWRSQVDILYVNRFETDLDQKALQAVFAARGHWVDTPFLLSALFSDPACPYRGRVDDVETIRRRSIVHLDYFRRSLTIISQERTLTSDAPECRTTEFCKFGL